MSEPRTPAPAPGRRGRRLRAALQVLLGLGLGLAAVEWAFSLRDGGAFPHVNFYVADRELGARLEPHATMRFALHTNPPSTIHVNGRGYRGDDWPPVSPPTGPGTGEILVVGDSQVFGLGVEDHETFGAKLAEATGRVVINGGVPTYGPQEYLAVTRELLEERRPGTVVYVLNFVNDPFELDRPNRDRHAIWDGWAVRIETAPKDVIGFPGRSWLYRRSHAFYAARRWWYERGAAGGPGVDVGLPSEGVWTDIAALGAESEAAARSEANSLARRHESLKSAAKARVAELEDNEATIDRLVSEREHMGWLLAERSEFYGKSPGDIVEDRFSESARSIRVTAEHIRAATRARRRLEQRLAQRESARQLELSSALARRDELREESERLLARATRSPGPQRSRSVFADHLAELVEVCRAGGAELLVVALPIDVQVSSTEWAKYGGEPLDMSDSRVLLDDVVYDAERLGVRALDATPALAGAEPGAFLDGDIHMTPRGHAALAQALAAKLAEPPPLLAPDVGFPPRSHHTPRTAGLGRGGRGARARFHRSPLSHPDHS